MGRRVPSSVIHQAHEWYMARPERRREDVAQRYGFSAGTFSRYGRALGLGLKAVGGSHSRTGARRPTTYQTVLAAYRAGESVVDLGRGCSRRWCWASCRAPATC